MFDKMKDMLGQLKTMQKLMKDDNFKALMANPKVQELFKDPAFLALVKENNPSTLLAYPKLATLMQDPDVARLLATIDFRSLLQA